MALCTMEDHLVFVLNWEIEEILKCMLYCRWFALPKLLNIKSMFGFSQNFKGLNWSKKHKGTLFWLEGLESTDPELLYNSQNVLRKVQHQDALQISDVVMASLLRMFQSTAGSGGVQEDALMAVSTLVEGQWAEFSQGMSLECKSFNGREEILTIENIVLSSQVLGHKSVQSPMECKC